MESERKRAPRMTNETLREPLRRPMSDDELLAMFENEEHGKYAIPHGLEPDGMKYEWKTESVIGRPNTQGMSAYQRRGWEFVPAERHPGVWTKDGHTGRIELDGMVLMEIDRTLYQQLRRVDQLRAKRPVDELLANLGSAPPGQAPRTPPRIRRTYETLPVEA